MTPEWRSLAACRDYPTAMFFTDRGESVNHAKAVCADCAVRAECLAESCLPGQVERIGIWGGMSERERRMYRSRLRRLGLTAPKPVERDICGSEAGYGAHRRHGEEPCVACKDGAVRANARRKAERFKDERRTG